MEPITTATIVARDDAEHPFRVIVRQSYEHSPCEPTVTRRKFRNRGEAQAFCRGLQLAADFAGHSFYVDDRTA